MDLYSYIDIYYAFSHGYLGPIRCVGISLFRVEGVGGGGGGSGVFVLIQNICRLKEYLSLGRTGVYRLSFVLKY